MKSVILNEERDLEDEAQRNRNGGGGGGGRK